MRFAFIAVFTTLVNCVVGQPYLRIKQNLKQLSSLTGEWAVTTQMISRDGRVIEESGRYSISWALDSTYIRKSAELDNSATQRKRRFDCWITYNPDSLRFEILYLYSRTAMRVFETGHVNSKRSVLNTNTVIKLADGREEFIRTELNFSTKDELTFRSWARMKSDENEFLDFKANMKRTK